MAHCPFIGHAPRAALASALSAALSTLATAQTPPAPTTTPTTTTTAATTTLDPVIVTGNPLGSRAVAAPVSVLSGNELTLRRASTLSETLAATPGVSSSWFGPNANRPLIRGLDGDRVRLLSNAGGSLDASGLSFDHAVPIDPLIVERLEVLRGPGALLYGGSAVGGVINALDNRIPDQRMRGVSGVAEARVGGAQSERGGVALVEAGNDTLAWHADVFGRRTSDLRVPTHTPIEDSSPLAPTDRVRNSQSRTSGGTAFFEHGHLGLSVDTYDSRYGVVVEPDITIDMKREHLGAAGALRFDDAPVRTLRAQFNHTRYRHQEIEGTGEVGTTFKTRGHELRVEAEHAPLGAVRGVLGLQMEDFDFSALGEEAFVPSTRTQRQALFTLHELPWRAGTSTAGVRLERARVRSAGDADPADARFGPAALRRYNLASASLGHVQPLAAGWSLSGSFSHTERAPTSYELYANGLHAATGVYERGDITLAREQGHNLDLALEWKGQDAQWRLGAYAARYGRFIALDATGNTVTVDGEDVPEYAFRPVRARLHGLEVNGQHALLQGPVALTLSGKFDIARGRNADTGTALPRMAPLRATLTLDARQGPWGGRVEIDHANRQQRVADGDAATPGYTLVHLGLTRRLQIAGSEGLWFLQLHNAGDTLAYNAASIRTVREMSPLPGRALKTGWRLAF